MYRYIIIKIASGKCHLFIKMIDLFVQVLSAFALSTMCLFALIRDTL